MKPTLALAALLLSAGGAQAQDALEAQLREAVGAPPDAVVTRDASPSFPGLTFYRIVRIPGSHVQRLHAAAVVTSGDTVFVAQDSDLQALWPHVADAFRLEAGNSALNDAIRWTELLAQTALVTRCADILTTREEFGSSALFFPGDWIEELAPPVEMTTAEGRVLTFYVESYEAIERIRVRRGASGRPEVEQMMVASYAH